jgi:hypothetical protein
MTAIEFGSFLIFAAAVFSFQLSFNMYGDFLDRGFRGLRFFFMSWGFYSIPGCAIIGLW